MLPKGFNLRLGSFLYSRNSEFRLRLPITQPSEGYFGGVFSQNKTPAPIQSAGSPGVVVFTT